MYKFLFGLLIMFSFKAQSQPSFIKDSIDTYINTAMKDWSLPGLAVVIVKDGKVAYMKGFGVKDIETKTAVDENTLFMIASNTKLFTGTSLAMLAQQKKLDLNDNITKYFPDYKLYDSTTTKLVTIKDMLSHRIGTKTFQGDFTFYNGNLSRGEIMYRMRYLKPQGKLRQDYGYCNSCYLVAGEIIPKAVMQPWEVFIYDSIVKLAGMLNTQILSYGIEMLSNIAKPYTTSFTGILKEIPYDRWDNLAPAASMVSNVKDLSKWLMLQLDSGKVNGRQVIPWQAIQATRDINIVINSRKNKLFPTHIVGYGLGLINADYNGKQIYWHTGGAGGMLSNVCFVPEENLGIAILTNNDNQNLFEALRYQILDAYLNVPYVNRSKQLLKGFLNGEKAKQDSITAWQSLIKNYANTKQFEGDYYNELYGKIIITAQTNKLHINFTGHNNLTARLSYIGNDEWLLEYNNIEFGVYKTRFKKDGKKQTLEIKMNPFIENDSYWFTRK